MDILNYRIVAHRGIHSNENSTPENSLPAFSDAVLKNVSIELDIHITKDNHLVVFHDHNLKRMTGVDNVIENCTLSEIKELKLINTSNTIPTLQDVLSLIDGKVPLVIELKNKGFSKRLEQELLKTLTSYNGDYVIESFNPFSLIWFKKHSSDIIRGQLVTKKKEVSRFFIVRFILSHMLFNLLAKPSFISYDINYINKKIANKCKRKNRYLFTWTIQNHKDLINSKNLKSDAIIFDTISLDEAKNFNI